MGLSTEQRKKVCRESSFHVRSLLDALSSCVTGSHGHLPKMRSLTLQDFCISLRGRASSIMKRPALQQHGEDPPTKKAGAVTDSLPCWSELINPVLFL